MASRIQGITVEIGGDTTKLSKALEGVNKSIKGTQSGLKDVNKLLKLDPTNTELVVQKQKMLKDAIEATKEKLATLKTAAQQANEQLANGEITQQQYDALQREIAETEQNLNRQDHRFGKLADKGENPGVPCRRGSPYLYRNLSDFGIDGIKEPFEVPHDAADQQLFQPVREPVGEKIHKPSLEQARQQGDQRGSQKNDAAASHELFHPQLGVKTLLDGGRRRTKNLYGVVKRTVPAGQVRQ